MKEKIRQYPVASFFILTMVWAFLVWSFLLPDVDRLLNIHPPQWLFWVGEIAPGGAALLLTILIQGRKGALDLVRPAFIWKVPPIYYYLVIIYAACFYLAAIGISALVGEKIPTFNAMYMQINYSFFGMPAILLLPIFGIIYLFCEELGWRGYALNKMLLTKDVFASCITIGFFWALFHLPLMLTNIHKIDAAYLITYFITTILDSFLFAWIYLKTDKSLLLVGLLHGATNVYGAFSPTIISSVGQGENLRTAILRLIVVFPLVVWAFLLRKKVPAKQAYNI